MAFLLLIEACQNYNITLEPEHIKADFELHGPDAELLPLYHFAQAIHIILKDGTARSKKLLVRIT